MMPVGPLSRYTGLSPIQVHHETHGQTQSLPVRREVSVAGTSDRIHLFTGADTFDLLARRFLGDEALYWRLLDANGGRLPDEFGPGELVIVPNVANATRVRR